MCLQFKEQFGNESDNVMVTLSLHSGQPFIEDSQIIPAVFVVEFLSTFTSLTSAVVTSSILSNNNQYSFTEFSDTVEPPEIAEITPNGKKILVHNLCILILFIISRYMQLCFTNKFI